MFMMLLALFSWWYTTGWAELARRVAGRVERTLQSFSVGLLAKSLFSPFRQISADNVQGSFDVQMRAFGDRLFSRFFGAFVRSFFILFGFVGALLTGAVGLVQLAVWPLVPALPVLGFALAFVGWVF
jgi:hypothetical protein